MQERGWRPGGASSGPGKSGGEPLSPGKQTLVQLQQDANAAAPRGPVDVDAEAARGTSGSPQPYPHRAAIETSLGRSLPAKAFFGAEAAAACASLGAEAYTLGDSVAFAAPSPSPQLAAHEAAHVVQQSSGFICSAAPAPRVTRSRGTQTLSPSAWLPDSPPPICFRAMALPT